jgi:hypothetical protein
VLNQTALHALPTWTATVNEDCSAARHAQSDQCAACLRLNLTARAALTHDTHEEVTEAIIEPLDVREHAHGQMARTNRSARACSSTLSRKLYSLRVLSRMH